MEALDPHLRNKLNRRALRDRMESSPVERRTLSFYRYCRIEEPVGFRNDFYQKLAETGVLGRVYVAREGVNGQVSVPVEKLDDFRAALDVYPFLKNLRLNLAREDDGRSFFLLDVKVRKKIVADGIDDPRFDPSDMGRHLSAADFNEITARPETVLVDMRNHYESEVGHFAGAVLPPAETFREELPMVVEMLSEFKDRPVVMYCTGGIRCEKASAWLKFNGFENVFQLDGGIIEYDRQVRELGLENKFRGKNFVFDSRLGERIGPEIVSTCHQCGQPSDSHRNCANDPCHLLFIQCDECFEKMRGCCSAECREFLKLPAEERKVLQKTRRFNGSEAGRHHGLRPRPGRADTKVFG